MTIKSIQKVIKIGSSAGVTLPIKDMKNAGIAIGSEVEITVKPAQAAAGLHKTEKITAEYEAFKKQYGQTLKNLADNDEVLRIARELLERHAEAFKNLAKR